MTTSKNVTAEEQILNVREFEFATTMRVLKAYPEDKLELRPAEKSRSAGELIRTFVAEEYVCGAAMRSEPIGAHVGRSLPDNSKDLLETFDRIHKQVQNLIAQAPDETLNRRDDTILHERFPCQANGTTTTKAPRVSEAARGRLRGQEASVQQLCRLPCCRRGISRGIGQVSDQPSHFAS